MTSLIPITIKRGTPLEYEWSSKPEISSLSGMRLVIFRDHGTYRDVLEALANNDRAMFFRFFVRGFELVERAEVILQGMRELQAGRMKRFKVWTNVAGSFRSKEVRDG